MFIVIFLMKLSISCLKVLLSLRFAKVIFSFIDYVSKILLQWQLLGTPIIQFVFENILIYIFFNVRSGAKIWRKDSPSYNSLWDYNKVFCYPIQDHMSIEDAEVEWLLLMDAWQRFAFQNPCVEIFETENMGLGMFMVF